MESNEEVAEEVIQENVPEEDQSGDFVPDEKDYMPRQKYNEVYGKMESAKAKLNKYSDFGDADELRSRLDKLDYWEKQVEADRSKPRNLTQEQHDLEWNNQQIRNQLTQVDPNYSKLKEIDSLKEQVDFLSSAQERQDTLWGERNIQRATSHLGSILKSNNIEADGELIGMVASLIQKDMSRDEEQAYGSGDFSGIDSAFSRNKEWLEMYVARNGGASKGEPSQNGSRPPQKAPMRHKSGGAGVNKESKRPMTMDEAANAGWERLKAAQ